MTLQEFIDKDKWQGMTLDELMKKKFKLKPGQYFHISAGTSFFCVIRPDEYEEAVDFWNDHYKDAQFDKIKVAYTNLVMPTSPYVPMWHDDKITTYYAMNADTKAYYEKRDKYADIIIKAAQTLAGYDTLRARKVIEFYPREAMKDGFIITIEGTEEGKFWDRKEYEKYMEGKNVQSKANRLPG